MNSNYSFSKFMSIFCIFCLSLSTYGQIPDPETYFGHKPGADYKMIRWDDIVSYFNILNEQSPRIKVEELGKTTLGNPFILVTISSPDNLSDLKKYKEISRKLALGKISEEEANQLAKMIT